VEDKERQAEEAKQLDEKIKSALRISLSPPAYDRLMNVRLANPKLYSAAAQQVLALYRQVNRRLAEAELLSLLKSLSGESRRETKITFK